MRSISTSASPILLGLSLLAGLSLTGCTKKENVEPNTACGTPATVRLCPGKTLMCPTEHTTLVLADGTRLQPTGPAWDAYQPQQQDGQVLRIGYTKGGTVAAGSLADVAVVLTCLETADRCGTKDPGKK
ncbi:hypothetical protein SAMN02745146_2972 [Hymenobacter daecheongensis DSM 21074]|uniref:Uncharacterized protein n=1 Tax=Hymenobacter daecheongensis DSM 21074 TaxID=1121955 RepID=A0A1M6IU33_9BACT|nr:hypothetical protein [Hymenobacter daecheongensis]SHJ37948.1 hypothetical protein SAMN02745146_2972 [Hymenobacter daecheongensis DSM 21074]